MKHGKPFLLSPVAIALLAAWDRHRRNSRLLPRPRPQHWQQRHLQRSKPKSSNVVEQVVTGFRASLESAINKKREDNGIVDVVKAETSPSSRTPTSPSRYNACPGVVIARDAGEGRNITVRGLGCSSPAFASTGWRRWQRPAAPTVPAATTAPWLRLQRVRLRAVQLNHCPQELLGRR